MEIMIEPPQEFRLERLSSTTCIRLVKIHTELVRGDISCTLQQYESHSPTCPAYVALSYVWGDSTARHTVYINGLTCRVHHSLWQLLNRIRTDEALACEWFWTDLLCIDQIHHSEKNEQISRMGDIYSEAKYVISWLGERTSTMDALRTFIQFSKKDDTQFPVKYAWKTPESHQIHQACDLFGLSEPYWGRVWIMQEVACAKVCLVVCGDIVLNFEDLVQMMETTINRSIRFYLPFDRNRRIQRIRGLADIRTGILEGSFMSILDLIERTSLCQATRDQDRIYGLLGLTRRLDPGFDCRVLEISYDKTLSDIWWDVIFMAVDDKSQTSKKGYLEALEKKAPKLPPPRNHLKLNVTTSIRRTQAEAACQVSEAAYSASIKRFLGTNDDVGIEEERKDEEPRDWMLNRWKGAMRHIWNHEENLPCLQTRLGRSALAGLQFTSWETRWLDQDWDSDWDSDWEWPSNPNYGLPSGWFCAAHLPDHLRNTTSNHRILPSYHYETEKEIDSVCPPCYGARYFAGRCDSSRFVLELEPLRIRCLVQRKRYKVDIEYYCDCKDPTAPCDKSDLWGSRLLDSDSEGSA